MKKEHIMHFKVIRRNETRLARGLIYLEENQQPSLQDMEQCLKDCGHQVQIVDKDNYIFKAQLGNEEYMIDVIEDYDKHVRDIGAETLARSFLK
ncbi:hypothetical protein [Paenibacillus agricola]|uniref:Uncharacterized protein n=1 Tax=Paenibacillus agricola TaxID=2716264 RepID=A0ABX0JF67_9BACL|nr:hypothetical protein [Paenibacillus agricola]NHN32340.1 hypothetical protein [Paenibacillus agricola]